MFFCIELVKQNFSTLGSPLEKCFWPPPGKIHYSSGTNTSDDHTPHMPLYEVLHRLFPTKRWSWS